MSLLQNEDTNAFNVSLCFIATQELISIFFGFFRSIYSPYDPFLATSLAQVQANGLAAAAAAAGNHGLDPRLQVIFLNLSRCPDLPRDPDFKVARTILFLYSQHTCFARLALGLTRSALEK